MGEIKKFAHEAIPESRFIFDRYDIEEEGADITEEPEQDYFSFFGSHEQTILKPESNFRNLHELMTYLPIDYYVLLQRGYQKSQATGEAAADGGEAKVYSSSIPRTNMVMFNNLPVLEKKSTFYDKKAHIVKALTYDDVYRCLGKAEAKRKLNDPLAEDELTRLLTEYYGGAMRKVEFINHDPERIVQTFHAPSGELGKDHLGEFQ